MGYSLECLVVCIRRRPGHFLSIPHCQYIRPGRCQYIRYHNNKYLVLYEL